MDTFVQYIIYLHIIAGAITLLTAPIAIIAKKTGPLHKLAGLTFFWAMAAVFVTAMIAGSYRFNLFLLMIGVFSFYSVYSGFRITRMRGLHKDQPVPWYDWVVAVFAALVMLGMIGLGLYLWVSGSKNQAYIVLIIFGALGLNGVMGNVKPFYRRPQQARYFYNYHMGNMLGGFIAATTAFTVQTLGRYFPEVPGLIFWLGPTVIMVPVIVYYSRKYRTINTSAESSKMS